MGIKNLMKILNDKTPKAIHRISLSDIKEKKVAIDTSIILYQYITAIRSSGDDLRGPDGKSTSHIQGILTKTLNYLKLGIIPIHVFDGKPPDLKMKILSDRSKIKKNAINKILDIETKVKDESKLLDNETINALETEKIKLLKQSVTVTHAEMREAEEIVRLLGVPCIRAPEEADSQCAYLSSNNLVDYVASEDMDLLTFGSKIILKNFMKKEMYGIKLNEILNEGGITMDQFIDICILLGCDYTDTIEGIGPKKSWDIIKKYGSLEELISKDKKIAENKYKLPDNFRYVESRDYFKNPRHIDIDPSMLTLKKPKINELKHLLLTKYGFNEDNIEYMLGFLRKKYKIYDEINDPFIDDEQEIIMSKHK